MPRPIKIKFSWGNPPDSLLTDPVTARELYDLLRVVTRARKWEPGFGREGRIPLPDAYFIHQDVMRRAKALVQMLEASNPEN